MLSLKLLVARKIAFVKLTFLFLSLHFKVVNAICQLGSTVSFPVYWHSEYTVSKKGKNYFGYFLHLIVLSLSNLFHLITFGNIEQAQNNGFSGPALGPKIAEKNERGFTEDQVKAGREGHIGTNKLASQSGQNFGLGRQNTGVGSEGTYD